MKIKKGDKVVVIAGNNKGKTGEVVASYPDTNKVTVSGVNMRKKTIKATTSNGKSTIKDLAMPIDVSNVKLAK